MALIFYIHIMRTLIVFISILFMGCQANKKNIQYLDYSGKKDKLSGGVQTIKINTPSGEFNVWTKRVGNNPTKKVLLLHGGPGFDHQYFQAVDSYFPKESIEYYYYDQLGSNNSDNPKDDSLWTIERFVDEVEQPVTLQQDLVNNQPNRFRHHHQIQHECYPS